MIGNIARVQPAAFLDGDIFQVIILSLCAASGRTDNRFVVLVVFVVSMYVHDDERFGWLVASWLGLSMADCGL